MREKIRREREREREREDEGMSRRWPTLVAVGDGPRAFPVFVRFGRSPTGHPRCVGK